MMFWKIKKDPNSLSFRREMAQKIVGHHVKYVTERGADCVEEVIGREGALALRNDELIVFASQDILFRTDVATMNAAELLSKDGVIITGPDKEHGGVERTIIVYYVYYR
jgi:hypothetical protein